MKTGDIRYTGTFISASQQLLWALFQFFDSTDPKNSSTIKAYKISRLQAIPGSSARPGPRPVRDSGRKSITSSPPHPAQCLFIKSIG